MAGTTRACIERALQSKNFRQAHVRRDARASRGACGLVRHVYRERRNGDVGLPELMASHLIEQWCAFAQDNRREMKPKFVDHSTVDGLAHDVAAAHDHDVLVRGTYRARGVDCRADSVDDEREVEVEPYRRRGT